MMVANPGPASRRRASQNNRRQDHGKKVITSGGDNNDARGNTTNATLNIVTTIFGGPEAGDTVHERKNYARAAAGECHSHHINLTQRKWLTTPYETINFTEDEAN